MDEHALLRQIPQIDALLRQPALSALPPAVAGPLARRVTEELRAGIRAGEIQAVPALEDLCQEILAQAERPRLREVINGTGVPLHTNLGRACLSEAAAQAALDAARRYANLEYDLTAGGRGRRHDRVEALLRTLTGAESALVVNNNAAAVLLALTALGGGGEVVVSRGELVEIGGSFRIPEIVAQCGCRLREVGATNKTRLRDYQSAIGPDTRAFLKVHTSNYRIVGFQESVPVPSLAELARRHRLPVIQDLGSGCLLDLTPFGIRGEPTVGACVRAGADLVTFSGDKLLGGPQAGLLVGAGKWVEPLKRHPLARALRVDKLTLAALEATLEAYLDPARAVEEIPVLRMLTASRECLRARGEALLALLEGLPAALVSTEEPAGGGSLPGQMFPGTALALSPVSLTAEELERRLRTGERPILGRVRQGRYLLHLRALWDEDFPVIAQALREVLA
ncbi:MAG: L-seryl-tRNA(Sec) selenium transferase [Oscillibacter sp.]|nr:L-seryl-tRNA(Sec) selenium transferase [Oscillibacter sp.]